MQHAALGTYRVIPQHFRETSCVCFSFTVMVPVSWSTCRRVTVSGTQWNGAHAVRPDVAPTLILTWRSTPKLLATTADQKRSRGHRHQHENKISTPGWSATGFANLLGQVSRGALPEGPRKKVSRGFCASTVKLFSCRPKLSGQSLQQLQTKK